MKPGADQLGKPMDDPAFAFHSCALLLTASEARQKQLVPTVLHLLRARRKFEPLEFQR